MSLLEDRIICGLVGIAGVIGLQEKKAFRHLLVFDTIRGEHSTGVLFVTSSGNSEIMKKVGSPFELFDSKRYESLLSQPNVILMGHNRHATQGAINSRNAHPFEFPSIIGMHNGTLVSQHLLDDSRDFLVDSENIYHHMEKNGHMHTAANLHGAYSLTWYNKEDRKLHFMRNKERPMCYTRSKSGNTLFWASEAWMLSVSLAKAKIDYGTIVETTIHKLYTLSMHQGAQHKLPDFIEEDVVPYVAPLIPKHNYPHKSNVVQGGFIGKNDKYTKERREEYKSYVGEYVEFYIISEHFNGNYGYVGGSVEADPSISIRVYIDFTSLNKKMFDSKTMLFTGKVQAFSEAQGWYLTIPLHTVKEIGEPLLAGPDGCLLTDAEYVDMTNKGCEWCGNPGNILDAIGTQWINKTNKFVCGACSDSPDVQASIQGM